MLDVAIVGGGLCGLALAHSLQAAKGLNWQLFEARERLGGRAWTVHGDDGTPVDLGATWFWPHNQPSITRLVADLGLQSFLQPDDGRVLHLHDPNQPVHAVALTAEFQPATEPGTPANPGAVHGGAMRVKGGIGAVIDAIAAPLPKARLNLDHRLISVVDRGEHVELTLQQGDSLFTVDARRGVLALPPRVLDATVRFSPELDGTLRTAMRDTPTWMATAAKAGFVYKKAFWREAGLTGNAWVTHSQAMLAEVFDASGPDAGAYPGAALAGFAAMGASQRPAFERSRALLLESQAVQLFGEWAADPSLQVTQLWKDWAQDDTTCSPLDVEEENMGGVGHPQYGLPVLAEGHWQGRLYLGGTETATRGGGYLEGALNAAGRLRKQLMAGSLASARSREAANDGQLDADNDRQLKAFADWVNGVRSHALERYRERVHTALSQQDADQLTQKAIIAAMEELYAEALNTLQHMPLHTAHQPVEQGRAALTPRVLSPFSGLADELLAEVVIYNRGSCALSNFPYEHKPGGDYLRTIRRDLAAVWQSFALSVNACLLGKREASPDTLGVTA